MDLTNVTVCGKCRVMISKKRIGTHRRTNRCAYQHGKGTKSKR